MKSFVTGNVPCGDCRLCCVNEIVLLEQGEEDEYIKEPHPAMPKKFMVGHNGKDCVYLGEKGCSIHDKRPKLCRDFDCRVFAVKFKWGKAQSLGIGDAWARGRQLLKEMA